MDRLLHGCAKTAKITGWEMKPGERGRRTPPREDGVNPKTMAKRREKNFVGGAPMVAMNPRTTALSIAAEAVCAGFRHHPLLSPGRPCAFAAENEPAFVTVFTVPPC